MTCGHEQFGSVSRSEWSSSAALEFHLKTPIRSSRLTSLLAVRSGAKLIESGLRPVQHIRSRCESLSKRCARSCGLSPAPLFSFPVAAPGFAGNPLPACSRVRVPSPMRFAQGCGGYSGHLFASYQKTASPHSPEIPRTQTRPTGSVRGSGEVRHIGSQFSQQNSRRVDLHPWNRTGSRFNGVQHVRCIGPPAGHRFQSPVRYPASSACAAVSSAST